MANLIIVPDVSEDFIEKLFYGPIFDKSILATSHPNLCFSTISFSKMEGFRTSNFFSLVVKIVYESKIALDMLLIPILLFWMI